MGLSQDALIESEVGSGLLAVGKRGERTQSVTALNLPNGLGHFSAAETNEDGGRDAQRNQSTTKGRRQ